MKLNRKSQVTMMIIIGIALFIVISLILYLSKSAVKKPLSQSIKKTQETPIEAQPIKEFVTKCLEKTAKDAILLIGKQGGYIYKSQSGTLVDFPDSYEGIFFVKKGQTKIAYNIRHASLYVPQPFSTILPSYPWVTFPYIAANSDVKSFKGIFGIKYLPPLKSSGGLHSFQSQIETYIENRVYDCLDFALFKEQGYDIETGKAKTKVAIGDRDVKIVLEMSSKISNTITKETFEIKEFSTVLGIRLKGLYIFVKSLIDEDITDITFNISDLRNNKDSFSVNVVRNYFTNDDLVIIKDDKSLIYSQPFEYYFARENRPVALYFIKSKSLSFEDGHIITLGDLLQDSELKAEDPDEDSYEIKINPTVPVKLDSSQMKFRIEATDNEFTDYQIITVNRK